MKKILSFFALKKLFQITVLSLLGGCGIIFGVLYVSAFNSGVFFEYSDLFIAVMVGLISTLTIFSISLIENSKVFIYKLFFFSVILITLTTFSLYLLKIIGLFDKINSVKEFRAYVDFL